MARHYAYRPIIGSCDKSACCLTGRSVQGHSRLYSRPYSPIINQSINQSIFLLARRCASAATSHACVSLSVTSRRSIETAERIVLVFGQELPSIQLTLCYRKFGYLQNKSISLWNFVQNSGLWKFTFGVSIVETCYRLSWQRWDRNKLDRRRSTKLTIPSSSDARPLVNHSNHQAVSTAQFRRAGQLATADTC